MGSVQWPAVGYCKMRMFSWDNFSLMSPSKRFAHLRFTIQWQFSSISLLKEIFQRLLIFTNLPHQHKEQKLITSEVFSFYSTHYSTINNMQQHLPLPTSQYETPSYNGLLLSLLLLVVLNLYHMTFPRVLRSSYFIGRTWTYSRSMLLFKIPCMCGIDSQGVGTVTKCWCPIEGH